MSENEEDDMPPPIQNDEEWQEIKFRFQAEGLDSKLPAKHKILHIWRWLTDAENNLKSLRNTQDKLRNQHAEELKEVETYVEHLRQLSNEKMEDAENEKRELHNMIEELRTNSVALDEIKEMLNQAGLIEIVNSNVSEQVAYLLVLRSRLAEELETERGKNHNLTDSLKLTQFQKLLDDQKADFEDELRHQRELTKQVKEELKRTHELEIMQIEAKLNAAQQTVKEVEERLNRQMTESDGFPIDSTHFNDKQAACDEKVKRLEYAKKKLETDNEALTYKISELLLECEEKENYLRKLQMINVGVKPYSRRGSTVDPPMQLRNALDNRESAIQDSKWSNEMRKLERDVTNLQEQLASADGRHQALALQYQQRRADGRSKMQKLKDVFQAKQSSLKDQINELEASLTVVRRNLSWEKECRQKIQTDFASLQKEKSDLVKRLLDSEENLREKTLQLRSLNLRLDVVEEDNAKLAKDMADIKKCLVQEALASSKVNPSYHQKSDGSSVKSILKWAPSLSPSRLAKLESVLVPANKDRAEVTV